MSDAVTQAQALLAAPAQLDEPEKIREIVTQLKREFEFGLARKLLEETRSRRPDDVWLTQQLALCTYKDEELHPARRYNASLTLLEAIGLRDPHNNDAETLSLGGAVHKRLWEYGGQLEHLYEALAFYRAAHERNPEQSMGYAGVNAAYICDLLAARAATIAKRSGTESREAEAFRQQARDTREQVRAQLEQALERDGSLASDYWFAATLAEAEFGLGNYPQAGPWLEKAGALPVGEWERQTTFRQLVSLARNQSLKPPPEGSDPKFWGEPWQALNCMLGGDTASALGCYRGRVGLALSGGGFRASFFHLGVMARLAEVDALRTVEVISSVSGGSIVAAHYYLELQRLLETKADGAISRENYIDLVLRVQERFLAGVQRNVRWRVFDDFIDNVRMLFTKRYSRSHKLGELYESELYSRVKDGKQAAPRSMPQLLVLPMQGDHKQTTEFRPKFQNWRRKAKVPVLLLNTTSLNSGHNWFFTASWMGEPPGLVGEEIDVNERYRRLYYSQAPKDRHDLRNFRLGHAVAASSCVPGLFEPLVIDELYPQRTLRLVDGGVHDNQGMQGLLDEGCTLILCSDASGQMADVKNPSDDPAGVLLRTSSILQDRVREAEYQDAKGRLDSRALEGLMFVHTKKELETRPLDWLTCNDSTPGAPNDDDRTSYGVDKELQTRIAALRTDLDAFTEVEAYSLMASGYLMTKHELVKLQAQQEKDGQPGTWGGFRIDEKCQTQWPFLPLQDLLAQPAGASGQRDDLGLQLKVGKEKFLKAWKLIPELKRRGIIAVGIIGIALIALIATQWHNPLFSITVGGFIMMILLLLAAMLVPALRWLNPSEEARSFAIKLAIAFTGYLLAKVHLNLVDPLFLARGKLHRLLHRS